jgi:ubiquinone/menaquinone biosynthesis C-methylase UbiE
VSDADRLVAEYARRQREIPVERYALTDPAALFIRHAIERRLISMLADADLLPLAGRRILDLGCGRGQWMADLESFGASRDLLAGLDLIDDRVQEARLRLPGADIRAGDATALPWPDGSFGLVVQSMMLSSVLDSATRRSAAGEMLRVLAPDGAVLSYDFFTGNPFNPEVRGVRRRELEILFAGCELTWRRVTLAPPLVRLLAPRVWAVAGLLQSLRVLDTHAMVVIRRSR